MWTHLQPFVEASFTEQAIRRRATVSLSRAMNLRRLIAFTGSGTTMSFGMPGWKELAPEFVAATARQLRAAHAAGEQDVWALERKRPQIEQLRGMIGLGGGGGNWHSLDPERGKRLSICNAGLAIELCEAILTGLPPDTSTGRTRLWLARRDFATGFRAGTDALAERRLRGLFDDISDGPIAFGEAGLAGVLTRIAAGEEIGKVLDGDDFRRHPGTAEAEEALDAIRKWAAVPGGAPDADALLRQIEHSILPDDDTGTGALPPRGTNVVEALVNGMGIDRFLTMNYDVELERAFLRRARRRGAEPEITPFRHLCRERPTDRDDPRTVTIEDGLRRAARSATLAPGTVGAMISFAAFARTYERQVFHLHGRLDDPANIVLTQNDYRRVYLPDDDAEQAFLEAQEVTFGGNDFLFVGVGMSEADVLRPFRRFVSRGIAPDQSPRSIVCLMAREHDPEKRRKAHEKAIEWIVHYDAYTIFYGDERYVETMWALDAVEGYLFPDTKAPVVYQAFERALKYLADALGEDRALLEPWARKDFRRRKSSTPQKVAARELLKLLRGRVRSRALVSELEKLKVEANRWWKAFRTTPRERRSIYSRVVGDPTLGTVTARHRVTGNRGRPVMWSKASPRWSAIQNLAAPEAQNRIERKGGLNIQRIVMPRGGGKGSLIHLLMRAGNRDLIFGYPDRTRPYADAFIAHLSFSMEFNSVLRAFSRFIAGRIAEIEVALLRSRYRVDPGGPSPVIRAVGNLQPKDTRTESSWRQACDDYVRNRREEPELALTGPDVPNQVALHASRGDGSQQVRRHRLETLRLLLTRYQTIASESERVFVCLSNLDRLCDDDGDGHNPVHRAFFRLITASADTNRDQPTPPIDLLLIAGRPDVPIHYLSCTKPSIDDVPVADQIYHSTLSKSGSVQERWHQLKPATWRERAYLTPLAGEGGLPDDPTLLDTVLEGGLEAFEYRLEARFGDLPSGCHANPVFRRTALLIAVLERATARLATGGAGVRGVYRQITVLLLNNAALTGLVMTLWANLPPEPGTKDGERDDRAELVTFLRALDAAAARYPEALYDEILSRYRAIDVSNGWDRVTIFSPKEHEHFDSGIFALVLRHLALFSLPVEPWVLLGCPILLSEFRSVLNDKARKEGRTDAADPAAAEWTRRGERLRLLRIHLEELVRRGLVIEVAPSVHVEDEVGMDELFIHTRFSLHARLREHLTRQMRLSVVDEGDSNHHQLSIYCDQPRDLPTPSRDHFAMIRDILDHQITRSRQTLELFYVLRPYWEGENAPENRGQSVDRAARMLFAPRDAQDDLAGYMGDIHAVPQRLRGCYSLLRGAFSLGAISRLRADALSSDREGPFESYQGWLRSLCNAAVGLEWNDEAIRTVLEGSVFGDDATVGAATRAVEEDRKIVEIAERGYRRLFDNHGSRKPDFATEVRGIREKIYESADRANLDRRQKVSHCFARVRHPLYRDEIAWTFNERGLAALVQGKVFDAVPLFGIARRMVEHSRIPGEEPHYHHATEHRIVLNLAIAQIERGRIGAAREELEVIERQTAVQNRWTPNPLHHFAKGYLAQCDHLSGSLQRAKDGYEQTIGHFVEGRRLRPVAIFNTYLADLLRAQGDLDGALRHSNLAMTAAAQAEQRDVQHYAVNAAARILAAQGKRAEAMEHATRVVDYSTRMGLYGLQAEGELTRASSMFDSGDTQLAGAATARAIALATRHGMRLRRLNALALYARIQIRLGRVEIARTVLDEAKSETERVGYQTLAARISEALARL